MRLSVCVDMGRPWPDIAALATGAEALGLDRVYVCDHFVPDATVGDDGPGSMFEALTVLAALGGLTRRIGLGTLVLGNAYRHPAVVANAAATLDRVTGGRFVLGLGAGWQRNEHEAYGIDLLPPSARLDRFAEACKVMRLLLTEERASFVGEWYRLTDARCEPKPERLPLLIGGGGERRTLPLAARLADEWHTWATPDDFRRKNAVLDRCCADVGRDPSTLARSTGDSVRASDATELLAEYRTAGADEFIVRDDRAHSVGESLERWSLLATVL